MVQAARGSIILPWEDDDISLPHRISQAVERINGYDYFNPRGSWFDDGKLHHTHSHGYLVNCSAITKEALLRVPFDNVSGNQDALWYYKADTLLNQSPHVLTSPREWSYIYRWGVRRHLSGFANTEQAYRDADKGIAGEYCITPRWHLDHKERVRLHLEKHGL